MMREGLIHTPFYLRERLLETIALTSPRLEEHFPFLNCQVSMQRIRHFDAAFMSIRDTVQVVVVTKRRERERVWRRDPGPPGVFGRLSG